MKGKTTTSHPRLVLIVESASDVELTQALLGRAHLPVDRVRILAAEGRTTALRLAEQQASTGVPVAVLVDTDQPSLADAIARARNQLAVPSVQVFCAMPEIEAWLFADGLALALAQGDPEAERIMHRLPLPEELPNARELARFVFGRNLVDVVERMDIERAVARSPSLRAFLEGMAGLLDADQRWPVDAAGRHLSRDIIAGLVREVPGDDIVWRGADGQAVTANEMLEEIERGTALGRQYASDLLRVSRDLLRRRSRKSA